MNNMNYIDLFSGCGGLSLGLHNAGWKGLFAIEKSKDAFETLKYNLVDNKKHFEWPDWLPVENLDIKEVLMNFRDQLELLKEKVTLIAGGPPCQGFSMAGRRNEDDERNDLVDYYIQFVGLIRPKILLFENVKGFTVEFNKKRKSKKRKEKPYSVYVSEELEKLGYKVCGRVVDFSEYGVPQRRKRFILIASLDGNPEIFFDLLKKKSMKFLKDRNLKSAVTVQDAISDLLKINGLIDSPDTKNFKSGIYSSANSNYQRYLRKGIRCFMKVADSHRFANHNEETTKVFQNIINKAPKNKRIGGEAKKEFGLNRRGVFLLDRDAVCPTLTTNPDDYIHYSEPRILTVREYARIQSFPDWYKFKGKYTTGGKRRIHEVPRYTQLGNAIPPLFSEQAGVVLKEMVLNDY